MNPPQGPLDELHRIWRQGDAEKEDSAMIIRLVQEKVRSFRELVREQNRGELLLALAFAPLTALAAWKAKMAVAQVGYVLLTLTLLAGSAAIWLHQRRENAAVDKGMNVLEYHRRLLAFYDARIRLLKRVKSWYAVPLLLGASLVILPVWARAVGNSWSLLIPAALILLAWVWMWHFNDVRRVGEIRRKKREVEELLAQMEQE